MKKLFLSLALGIMAFGTALQASASARLDSMTADSREVDDIDLIWLYPNKVLDYKNTVDFRLAPNGDFGEGVSEWGGVITEVSPDLGVWAAYVNRPEYQSSPLSGTVDGFFISTMISNGQRPTGNYTDGYSNVLDLFWAKNLGGADLGIHFNYGATFLETDNLGLSLGLGLTDIGPFNRLSFHADYAFMDLSKSSNYLNNGTFTMKAGALAVSDLDKDSSLRLFLDFLTDQSKAVEIAGPPFSTNYSDFESDLGISVNRKISAEKGLISSGFQFDYFTANDTDAQPFPSDYSFFSNYVSWTLVWNASLEYPVYDWLTLRGGLAKALVARIYNGLPLPPFGDTYFDSADQPVVFNLGFGINWQNWILDANVDVTSLENSINNTQPGNGLLFDNGNPLAQVVSADLKYKF